MHLRREVRGDFFSKNGVVDRVDLPRDVLDLDPELPQEDRDLDPSELVQDGSHREGASVLQEEGHLLFVLERRMRVHPDMRMSPKQETVRHVHAVGPGQKRLPERVDALGREVSLDRGHLLIEQEDLLD